MVNLKPYLKLIKTVKSKPLRGQGIIMINNKPVFYFKSALVMLIVLFAWLAYDIIDSYDIEWPTYDKSLEQSKMRFDQNGNRLNRKGWE